MPSIRCICLSLLFLLYYIEVIENYDPTQHPDVRLGIKKPQEIFRDFLRNFEVSGEVELRITRNDFINYYSNVSAAVGDSDDKYFEAIVRGAWHLNPTTPMIENGGSGARDRPVMRDNGNMKADKQGSYSYDRNGNDRFERDALNMASDYSDNERFRNDNRTSPNRSERLVDRSAILSSPDRYGRQNQQSQQNNRADRYSPSRRSTGSEYKQDLPNDRYEIADGNGGQNNRYRVPERSVTPERSNPAEFIASPKPSLR